MNSAYRSRRSERNRILKFRHYLLVGIGVFPTSIQVARLDFVVDVCNRYRYRYRRRRSCRI